MIARKVLKNLVLLQLVVKAFASYPPIHEPLSRFRSRAQRCDKN